MTFKLIEKFGTTPPPWLNITKMGSGALPGKMLLVRIVKNIKFDAHIMSG